MYTCFLLSHAGLSNYTHTHMYMYRNTIINIYIYTYIITIYMQNIQSAHMHTQVMIGSDT